jgi:post-segregation antitoxin (ccd killing protein)
MITEDRKTFRIWLSSELLAEAEADGIDISAAAERGLLAEISRLRQSAAMEQASASQLR